MIPLPINCDNNSRSREVKEYIDTHIINFCARIRKLSSINFVLFLVFLKTLIQLKLERMMRRMKCRTEAKLGKSRK